MFTIGLLIGLTVGTLFAPVILKWYQKARATAKEVANDVRDQANKNRTI